MAATAARTGLGDGSMVTTARALDAAFEGAARSGDATRLAEACYAQTGRLVPPNGPGVRGRDQIRACWRDVLDSGLADVALDTPDVVSTGDVAYGIGRYTLVYRPAGGGSVRDAGRRVVAYRRQADGHWAVTADIWTSDGLVTDPPARHVNTRGGRGCRRGATLARTGGRRAQAWGCRLTRSAMRGGVTP